MSLNANFCEIMVFITYRLLLRYVTQPYDFGIEIDNGYVQIKYQNESKTQINNAKSIYQMSIDMVAMSLYILK